MSKTKNHIIKDSCSVLAAILITGSMAYAMKPPKIVVTQNKATVAVSKPETVKHTVPIQTPVTQPTVAPEPVYTGHELLMHEAGIADSDFGAVDYIISHESSWDPDATEPTSGAHGLPQALPYSKTNCGWSDAICQLTWADTYAKARYGGWWQAQAYWATNKNW